MPIHILDTNVVEFRLRIAYLTGICKIVPPFIASTPPGLVSHTRLQALGNNK